ncbi:GGDEF domain-containing protein [Nocardia sp. CDC159]|uniref:GGDEF domain-containing protein n=1 Tax=Nocardia pulmonis TaxID=2951408 RepID=A0A9X2J1U1_9NOCA|nr:MULTISPECIES: GGDEF domain-containing protein [Nocardia]MCM6778465.1 GGDEF domain-containing protein [Nocardia pulmonis]MCM6791354.1 GGDEF domain-containing protein [Nocardia sp. CDC159]
MVKSDMKDSGQIFRSWWGDRLHYCWPVHAAGDHSFRWRLKVSIGAVGIVVVSLTGITLIVVAGREAPAGAARVCLLAVPSALWTLRWWLLPWPGEFESLLWVALLDVAVGIHNVIAPDPVLGATGNALLVATGAYLAIFHGPRALLVHAGWSLLSISALPTLAVLGYSRSGDIGVTLVMESVSPLVVACCVLPVVQFCCWLFRRDAHTDPLTGLANRRGLECHLLRHASSVQGWPRWLTPCGRQHRRFYFAAVDIDGFKIVNDHYGHSVGDELLIRTARQLRAAADPDALVARTGGDEFVVVGHLRDGMDAVAERLRGAITAVTNVPVAVTASIGVALCDTGPAPGEGGVVCCRRRLRLSDEAMYVAKRLGGNRVVVAKSTPGEDPSVLAS